MSNELHQIRKYLKEKCLNNKLILDKENKKNELLELINQTVYHGESNSILIIGPRGNGKTLLVNNTLEELFSNKTFKDDAIVVKLNGLIQTDDRLALKSMTTQMQLDNFLDGKVFGSFAENLAFLLACLKTGEKYKSKSVIFILEEFDLFCSHHNQTLLYNLFDVAQSDQTSVCILGLTCRFDVVQLLEKRVKSRFSHRQMFIYAKNNEKITDLDFAKNRLKYYLSLPDKKNNPDLIINSSAKQKWNKNLENLIQNKQFLSILERIIGLELNEWTIKNLATKFVFSLAQEQKCNYFTIDFFENELNRIEKDELTEIIQDLTVLEICLLIAMKHHCEIYDNQPMNFQMIFSRYIKFANRYSSTQVTKKLIVIKAFEHIECMELISLINAPGNTKALKEYQFFKLLITSDQLMKVLNELNGLPTEILQWAKNPFF